jgi:ATP-binding cassette subfamily F protein uup
MMSDLADLRERNTQAGTAKIDFTASDRKTRKLVELKHVAKSLGGRQLFKDVNVILSPGTKLGLLGPNGSGKSTLIRLINGALEPDSGEIFRADQLRVVVFDQHREQLDPNQTLRRALSPGGDNLVVNGVAMHVTGWAKRFLFQSEQLDMPVGELSGGEQARVLIARLMVQPADVLILDEPTNDLDIATLDVLEESLTQFPGALVLVTHDRYLLDRVSSEILALDGKGAATIYVDLAQWERAREEAEASEKKATQPFPKPSTEKPKPASEKKRLTWNEQRELERMEATILAAETEVESLQTKVVDPKIMADHVQLHDAYEKLAAAQHEVERLYARWADLESRKT